MQLLSERGGNFCWPKINLSTSYCNSVHPINHQFLKEVPLPGGELTTMTVFVRFFEPASWYCQLWPPSQFLLISGQWWSFIDCPANHTIWSSYLLPIPMDLSQVLFISPKAPHSFPSRKAYRFQHPTLNARTAENYEGSEISLSLQANKCGCPSFMDVDRPHKTPGHRWKTVHWTTAAARTCACLCRFPELLVPQVNTKRVRWPLHIQ